MRRLCTIASLLVALASPVLADATATFREGGRALFSFDVPDFWTLRTEGVQRFAPPGRDARPVPQILSMHPTSEPKVWMGFYSPPGITTVADGREYLREIGRFLADAPQVTDDRMRSIGGRQAEVIRGTGKRKGKAIRFAVAIIDLPGPRIAIAASVVEAGADADTIAVINEVFGSFRAR